MKTEQDLLLAQHAFPELVEQAGQRREQLVGAVALTSTVETETVDKPRPSTLLANLHEARFGDREAVAMVRRNVSADVAERLFKAGHITVIPLERTHRGLEQNGLPMASIHRNTLEHMPLNTVMRERTQHELGNIFLFEEMDDIGVFEEHDAVVMSATPTDGQTREDFNFFTDTDSLSIQYLKKISGGKFVMETAFVAGKTMPDAPRHDLRAIRELLEEAGMEQAYFDENKALSFVILVKKTPASGVHDVVERFDNIVGGTFFGEEKPRQDYQAYRKVCEARERQFADVVTRITNQILAEAHTFKTPYDAVRRLDELSDFYCIERAAKDTSIDLRVFGTQAAMHIEQMRLAMEQGDDFLAGMHLEFAKRTSTSSSCPLFKNSPDGSSAENDSQSESDGADCEFTSKECPLCGKKNVKTKVTKTHIIGACGCKKRK